MVDLYLNKGMSTEEIASRRHVEHQRISQILKLGIDYLISAGKIELIADIAA